MDALEVFGLDAVPADVGMGVALQGDGADEVLDEDRPIVGLFGDVLFIRSLEKGENFRTAAGFDQGNEVLDPYGLAEGDLQTDVATLVVGPAGADGLAAGAEGGDGNSDGYFEGQFVPVQDGVKAGLIVHQTRGAANGSLLFDEVGKLQFQMGGLGMELVLQGPQNLGDALDMDEATMVLQNLEEAAHMGALELMNLCGQAVNL